MQTELIFTPADFVAVLNQTLEFAYQGAVIEGELSSFRVSRGQWVYFDLKDDIAQVSFFASVRQLPGPLEDGMMVRVAGTPRLHARFGFSINVQSITLVGEGTLKKAELLLKRKLEKEGLFLPERKRSLPAVPQRIGLVTASGSAAYADFIKIVSERWGNLEIYFADALVQGASAPEQIVQALEILNKSSNLPEVIVITRGGGSAEDLAAFNDERVVRAIAASRVPTLVAIGHEVDESLAELVADARASTPTNAATAIVPDSRYEIANLINQKKFLKDSLTQVLLDKHDWLSQLRQDLNTRIYNVISTEQTKLTAAAKLAAILDPKAALKRGYALVSKDGKYLKSVQHVSKGDGLAVSLADGTIQTKVEQVLKNG